VGGKLKTAGTKPTEQEKVTINAGMQNLKERMVKCLCEFFKLSLRSNSWYESKWDQRL